MKKRIGRIGFRRGAAAALCAAAAVICGCSSSLVNVNLNVVGEQTALEKQVLGTYRSLGEDLMIYSSVRGVDSEGGMKVPPKTSDSQQAACSAMRNRQYNRDDVDRLLKEGVAGEGRDGMLAIREEFKGKGLEGLAVDQVEKVVREENTDRQVILDRLVKTTPDIGSDEHGKVAWIFAGLNQESAPAGSWVQDESGAWRKK